MIYQSGYLTIKGYDERFGIYRLGFPNREVEEGFIRFLLPYYANVNKVESPLKFWNLFVKCVPVIMNLFPSLAKFLFGYSL